MAVAVKQMGNERVVAIDRDGYRSAWARLLLRCARPMEQAQGRVPPGMLRRGLRGLRELLGEPARLMRRFQDCEDFDFPWSAHLLEEVAPPADLLHGHNLYGRYLTCGPCPP